MAYRVSCYTHSPQLNITLTFKIIIYLILEHIYTSIPLEVYSIHGYFLMSNLHRSLASAQLCPLVPLPVFYFESMPLSKPSIPSAILRTDIWSTRSCLQSCQFTLLYSILNCSVQRPYYDAVFILIMLAATWFDLYCKQT